MRNDSQQFAAAVLERYRGFQRAAESGSLIERRAAGIRASAHLPNGHPDFVHLELGQSGHCDAVAMFFDLAKFTWRTFWEPPEKVRMLAQAVLGQLSLVVQANGGYVLGLRGDGLFACFGNAESDPRIDMGLALGSAAFAMDATQNALNQLLRISDIEPVQLRVGADYGRMDFTRTGTVDGSEINCVSFAANFAAKCEKYADAWEVVIGEGLAMIGVDRSLIGQHKESPKTYTLHGETKAYRFYDLSWQPLVSHVVGVREALGGRPSSAVRIH